MYIKAYDTSVSPPKEIILEESFLFSAEYRKSADGRVTISVQRQLSGYDIGDNLESRTSHFYSVADVQIDLYSGDTRIKSVRACPTNYSINDRQGVVTERLDMLVGGKIFGSSGQIGNGVNSGESAQVEYPPTILSAAYFKQTGELVITSDHLIHSLEGFLNSDFDITKFTIGGVRLVAGPSVVARGYTDHFKAVWKLEGANRLQVEAVLDKAGSQNSKGETYVFTTDAGWNHSISVSQNKILSVYAFGNSGIVASAGGSDPQGDSGTPSYGDGGDTTGGGATTPTTPTTPIITPTGTPVVTSMQYDIPTAVLTINGSNFYSESGTMQTEDVDGSFIIVNEIHSFAWTNVAFISGTSTQIKLQIKGNCVDFMNGITSKNGTVDVYGHNYTYRTRPKWNGVASIQQTGILEMVGYVDTKAPVTPTGFMVMEYDGSLHAMAFEPNIENDLAGYNFYLDGVKVNSEPSKDFMYDITGLTNGKKYNVYMTAIDVNGNESGPTPVVEGIPHDQVKPNAPTSVSVTQGALGLHISWTANGESDTVGYNLYVDGAIYNGSPITETSIDIDSDGATHNYSVTAVDMSGNESDKSEVVNH